MSNLTIQEAVASSTVVLMERVSEALSPTDPTEMSAESYRDEVAKVMRELTMHALRYFYLGLVMGLNNTAVAAAAWEAQKESNPAFVKSTEELAETIRIAP